MLNKVIKLFFSIVGAFTGYTLTRTFFLSQELSVTQNMKLFSYISVALIVGAAFYFTANKFITAVLNALDKFENRIQSMTLYELAISVVGLIAGLIVANLLAIPISRLEIIGLPLSIISNILFACLGIAISTGKKNEHLMDSFKNNRGNSAGKNTSGPKLLDTSVIIDGRIVDICRTGFIEGELVIPEFVLEELRHIADSSDALKRNKGRRGLDIVNMLQKELNYPVRVESIEVDSGAEVDDKLLKAAQKFGCKIVTIDYNLNKVANISGVSVLNINELANAVKPIALPGEEMTIQVIKDGKENGQGIGYLEDGTMIVVEGGRRHMGETVSVTVTSVLQTAAGRMIFAKPKGRIEKVI
ncbi:MAG: TRAM domain-containing protein [Clostridia bacterium]|nr:TRAM domain-containing protein [Clostridia bacterium]